MENFNEFWINEASEVHLKRKFNEMVGIIMQGKKVKAV
jgi:hypothetical protein